MYVFRQNFRNENFNIYDNVFLQVLYHGNYFRPMFYLTSKSILYIYFIMHPELITEI